MADAGGNNTQGNPNPGILSGIIGALKPAGPIPQKWLDTMLANSNNEPKLYGNVIAAITKSAATITQELRLNRIALESIGKSIGPKFETTFVDALKKYDTSFAQKQNDATYEKRKKLEDKDKEALNNKLVSDLSENITSSATGKASDNAEAATVEAELSVQVAQPVILQSISEAALESLQKLFSTAIPKEAKTPAPAAAATNTGGFGSWLGNLGDSLKKLGSTDAMKGAITIALLGVSLYAAAKGFQQFALVTWEGMAKGFVSLLGLVGITKLLANSATEMIIGAGAIAILSGALWLAGKGFQVFGNLDWIAIGKGFTALLGLAAVAVVLGIFSEVAIPGAIAIGILGLALLPFGLGLMAAAKAFDIFAVAVTKFTTISWSTMAKAFVTLGALIPLGVGLLLAAPGLALAGLAFLPFSLGLYTLGKAIGSFVSNDFTKVNDGVMALLKFGAIGALLSILAPELALFGLAMIPFSLGLYTLGKAIGSFLATDFDKVNEGILTLLKFGGVGAVLGLATPFLVAAAVGLTAFGLALLPFSLGLVAVNGPLETFTTQLRSLSTISATDILALSGAVVALGVAIAGFGVGAAAAGIGNFVGGLFNKISGSKSPIDQLIAIGEQATNIQTVSSSINSLKQSLSDFGNVKIDFAPLNSFIDNINKVSLVKVVALATTLTAVPSLAAKPVEKIAPPPAATTEITKPGELPTTPVTATITKGAEPIPVSIVPTELNTKATIEANKLSNIGTTASIPNVEEPTNLKDYNDNLEKVVERLDTLVKVMKSANKASANVSSSSNNNTVISNTNNNSIPNTAFNESNRDIPYLERNKYRQNIMYSRTLL